MPLVVLREAVASLNLFKSYSDNPETIRSERLRTRIYLILFSLALIAIVVYGALSLRTTTITKYSPTEHEFTQLSVRYPDTTRCPCSRVSIGFSEFLHLEVTYHTVCSSDFLSQAWIEATFNENITRISPLDLRKTLSAFWQTIRSLCTLVQTAVSDGFDDFKAQSFIGAEAQTREFLQTQSRLSLNFSLQTSLAKLKRNLLMNRQSISGNRFISGLNTNYRLVTIENRSIGATVQAKPIVLPNGCSCFDPSGCPQPILLLENQSTTGGMIVPGMMFNCQPFDGALASSLECFYQPSCLSLLQQALFIPRTPLALTSTGSRYSSTTTVKELVDGLMIEQLSEEALFTQYYSRCNPTYCIYSYSQRFDVFFIVTLLISAFGGLSIIAKLISAVLVKAIIAVRSRCTQRNLRPVNTILAPSPPRKSSLGD